MRREKNKIDKYVNIFISCQVLLVLLVKDGPH